MPFFNLDGWRRSEGEEERMKDAATKSADGVKIKGRRAEEQTGLREGRSWLVWASECCRGDSLLASKAAADGGDLGGRRQGELQRREEHQKTNYELE